MSLPREQVPISVPVNLKSLYSNNLEIGRPASLKGGDYPFRRVVVSALQNWAKPDKIISAIIKAIQERISMYGNVLQIMPAQPGWEAVFAADKNLKAKSITYFTKPLNCWAVVEFKSGDTRAPSTLVVGMISVEDSHVLDFVDLVGDFLGYNYPGCQTNWHVKASTFRNDARHASQREKL